VQLTAPVMLRDIVALTDSQRELTGPCEAFLAHFKTVVTELAGHSPPAATRKRKAV